MRGKRTVEYRYAYINHIRRFWRTMQDMSGIAALKKVNEMQKIEVEYFGKNDSNFEVDIPEDSVVLPNQPMNMHEEQPNPLRIQASTARGSRLTFTGGVLKLTR